MSTVLRMDGYAVVIHTARPPSTSTCCMEETKRRSWSNLRPIAVREVRGMRPQHVVKAVRIVEEHRIYLLIKWRAIHG